MTLPSDPCPCGSSQPYKRCCRPLHRGQAAPTPERLMRSRYSAYALRLTRYILATTHPDGPQHQADRAAWRREVHDFCEATTFDGLEVVGAGQHEGDAWVTFRAQLTQHGTPRILEERSCFRRHKGRWSYHGPWDDTRGL